MAASMKDRQSSRILNHVALALMMEAESTLKYFSTSMRLHGAIYQKTAIFYESKRHNIPRRLTSSYSPQ
jgi:hypothetical protein